MILKNICFFLIFFMYVCTHYILWFFYFFEVSFWIFLQFYLWFNELNFLLIKFLFFQKMFLCNFFTFFTNLNFHTSKTDFRVWAEKIFLCNFFTYFYKYIFVLQIVGYFHTLETDLRVWAEKIFLVDIGKCRKVVKISVDRINNPDFTAETTEPHQSEQSRGGSGNSGVWFGNCQVPALNYNKL